MNQEEGIFNELFDDELEANEGTADGDEGQQL